MVQQKAVLLPLQGPLPFVTSKVPFVLVLTLYYTVSH